MASHSSILAWKFSSTSEPGELCSSWSCQESDTTELSCGRIYLKMSELHENIICQVPKHLRGGKEPAVLGPEGKDNEFQLTVLS